MPLTRYASSNDDYCSISVGFVSDWNLWPWLRTSRFAQWFMYRIKCDGSTKEERRDMKIREDYEKGNDRKLKFAKRRITDPYLLPNPVSQYSSRGQAS
jgi:hypothetical protein